MKYFYLVESERKSCKWNLSCIPNLIPYPPTNPHQQAHSSVGRDQGLPQALANSPDFQQQAPASLSLTTKVHPPLYIRPEGSKSAPLLLHSSP